MLISSRNAVMPANVMLLW